MTQHNQPPATAPAAIDQITNRAARDADFRALCLTDPAGAVRTETGVELPEGFVLRFVENAHADLTVVLPDLEVSGEMSESDLETVAGGQSRQNERARERERIYDQLLGRNGVS